MNLISTGDTHFAWLILQWLVPRKRYPCSCRLALSPVISIAFECSQCVESQLCRVSFYSLLTTQRHIATETGKPQPSGRP